MTRHSSISENTEIGIHSATLNRFALSFSSPPWSIAGMLLTQQEADEAMGQEHLLRGEALSVIASIAPDHKTFHSSPRASAATSVARRFLLKVQSLRFSSTSMSLWQPVAGKELFPLILKQLEACEVPRKRVAITCSKHLWGHSIL